MKLEIINDKFDNIEAELYAAKDEVNMETLKNEIRDKKKVIDGLNGQAMLIKEEKSQLESQREIVSEISMKTSDMNEKQRRMDRTMSSKNSELALIFGEQDIPKTEHIKEAFSKRRNELLKEKEDLEKKEIKLNREKDSQRDAKKTLTRDIETKEDRIKKFERKLLDSDLIEGVTKMTYGKAFKIK